MSELQVLQTRKVTVFDSASGFLKIYETATTSWKDIVDLLEADGFSLSGKEAVLSSTKGHLVLPEAEIPTGDQKIFTIQAKMKSGATKAFKDMTYLELRRACSGMENVGSSPTKKYLLALLETNSKIKETRSIKAKKVIVEQVKKKVKDTCPVLEERVQELENRVGQLYSVFSEAFCKPSNTVKTVVVKSVIPTLTDLEKEAAEIKAMMGR